MSARWLVPYTAPGILRGRLVVEATSREDAINAAIEVHGRRSTRNGNPSWRLHRTERARIQYGEPVAVDAVQIETGRVAS